MARIQTREQKEALDHARMVWSTESAFRALDDPARVRRATHIVRAALARKVLTIADLTPLPELDGTDHA